jgi:hypothetical protein
MQTWESERSPELFVAEAWPETQGTEDSRPASRPFDDHFPLEPLFVFGFRPSAADGRRFRGDDRSATRAQSRRSGANGRFGANAKHAPGPAQVGIWSIVKGVLLEYAPSGDRTKASQAPNQSMNVPDRQLDFNLSVCRSRHRKSISDVSSLVETSFFSRKLDLRFARFCSH